MQKAIIHTPTRVIRRLTIDENHQIAPDETIVELENPIDIGNGFWKLNPQNIKVPATQQESIDAGVNEIEIAKIKKAKYDQMKGLVEVLSNGVDNNVLKEYFKTLKELL